MDSENIKKSSSIANKTIIMGAGAIMLAALLWSLDGVFIRPKLYQIPADLVVFIEHSLGFLFLCPFIILNFGKIKLLRLKDWLAVFWICFFGGLLGTIMITKAFFAAVGGEVTFATVVLLQKFQPVFALLLARIILKEKLTNRFYWWAGIAIISGYFLAFGKTGLDVTKIDFLHNAAFFAFLAAFAFGSSTVFGKRIVNHLDYKITATLRFGLTAIMALILIFLTGSNQDFGEVNRTLWFYFFIIVFSSGAAAMFIYYFGLKRISASAATICELFWPLSAIFLDYILNKNILNWFQIISAGILLLSFYKIVTVGEAKKLEFDSRVIKGSGRGSKLGFPTINLETISLDIDYGVYLAIATVDNKKYPALLHFGIKETFSEKSSAEIFIKQKIYDVHKKNINIKIIKKIRDIKKFADSDLLRAQLREDLSKLEEYI